MKKILIFAAFSLPLAGCFSDSPPPEEIKEEVVIEKKQENTDNLEYLADSEALVDTVNVNNTMTEYYTNGSYVELKEDKVILYTPEGEFIRDKAGVVKVSDLSINADNQNLIYRDGKIVIQQILGKYNPDDYGENVQVVKVNEKIVDIERTEINDFSTKEYSKESYDRIFAERETFKEGQSERKVSDIINNRLIAIMDKFRAEHLSKLKEEEAKQESIEAVKKEQEEKEKQDVNGEIHTHDFQPVYSSIHHDAVTHQETYVEKEPYTVEEDIESFEVYGTDGNVLSTFTTEDEAKVFVKELDDIDASVRKVVTGTREKTEYKEVTKTRTVVDREAYDETVINYKCTICGAEL